MSDGGRSPRTKTPSPRIISTSSRGRGSLSARSPRPDVRSSATNGAPPGSSSSQKLPLHPPMTLLDAALLGRSVSADTPSTHRNSARGHAYLSSGGVAAAAARRSGAAAAAASVSLGSSSSRGNNFFMMDIDSARQSVDNASSSLSRSMLSESASSFSSSGRYCTCRVVCLPVCVLCILTMPVLYLYYAL